MLQPSLTLPPPSRSRLHVYDCLLAAYGHDSGTAKLYSNPSLPWRTEINNSIKVLDSLSIIYASYSNVAGDYAKVSTPGNLRG